MSIMYCALCGRPVEAKRRIGVGTVCLAVLTGGMWLLAIPFYRKRCSICSSTAVATTLSEAEMIASRTSLAPGSTLQTRLADMEQRLSLTEGELEAATVELDRLRKERDFDRQLREGAAARESERARGSE